MISRITALEIFTNPGDLEFTIVKEKDGDKFALGISWGPGHRYKPLVTTRPLFLTKDDAILAVEEVLNLTVEASTQSLEDPGSLIAGVVNPDGGAIDQTKVLNKELIARILEELRLNDKANTCEIIANAA